MMAHGDNDLAIGDKVTASYQPFAGRLVPYFEKAEGELAASKCAQRSNPELTRNVIWIASEPARSRCVTTFTASRR